MGIKILLAAALAPILASCGGGHNAVTADNDTSACDTGSFDTIAADSWTGVAVKNNAGVKIKSITVYADNTSPLLVEVKSVRGSEPNRIYGDDSIEDLSGEAIICKPEGRGFCTVELADKGIAVRGDIFVLFRAASAEGEAPRLAKYRYRPDGRFLSVSIGSEGLTYSDVEGLDIIPPFVSIGIE